MREMHKWKDKVELSLDNRQIFFLFFGLSVVGCFIFALGVMTGRRLDWQPIGEATAMAEPDSLSLLSGAGDEPEFAFERGLRQPTDADIPPTRDPSEPPATPDEIEARKAAEEAAKAEAPAPEPAPEAAAPTPAPDVALAAAKPELVGAPDKADDKANGKRRFTLQMKAFSRSDEAESFADKLRRDGHDIRVEVSEVRGRTWHRVRLGSFETWAEGLKAKQEFEKSEHVIAYVVAE
jgi:cell division septation protein DedD